MWRLIISVQLEVEFLEGKDVRGNTPTFFTVALQSVTTHRHLDISLFPNGRLQAGVKNSNVLIALFTICVSASAVVQIRRLASF